MFHLGSTYCNVIHRESVNKATAYVPCSSLRYRSSRRRMISEASCVPFIRSAWRWNVQRNRLKMHRLTFKARVRAMPLCLSLRDYEGVQQQDRKLSQRNAAFCSSETRSYVMRTRVVWRTARTRPNSAPPRLPLYTLLVRQLFASSSTAPRQDGDVSSKMYTRDRNKYCPPNTRNLNQEVCLRFSENSLNSSL